MQPSEPDSVKEKQRDMTTARTELGISPVLFQAIAQLTAASSASNPAQQGGSSGGDNNQSSDIKKPSSSSTSLLKQAQANNRDMENSQNNKDASRVMSQLLQKLNEPVSSFVVPHSRSASQLLMSTANVTGSDSKQSASSSFTQAGLSMLGITSENNNTTSASLPSQPQTSFLRSGILGEELNNFLLKQEPIEEDVSSSANTNNFSAASAAPTINTNVSSVLSALASQHAQQQQQQRSGGDASQQQQLKNITSLQFPNLPNTCFRILNPSQDLSSTSSSSSTATSAAQSGGVVTVSSTNNGSNGNVNTSNQQQQQQQPQQIIIYGVQCDNNNIVSTPGSSVSLPLLSSSTSSSSSARVVVDDNGDNNLVIEEGGVATLSNNGGNDGQLQNQQQTTFRLQMQSPGNIANNNNNNTITNATTANQKSVLLPTDGNYNMMQQAMSMCMEGGTGTDSGNSNCGVAFSGYAVSDAQNSSEGMSHPCPICCDKVSGYHYGIFTCESCKGFFKRTVQNKKTFVCPRSSDCEINAMNRKKCPACRFKRCLDMGMRLEAIRQDRTRGGRSSYEGCTPHKSARPVSVVKKQAKRGVGRVTTLTGDPSLMPAGPSQEVDDGSSSHRNLVAILNHGAHKQNSPSPGMPVIPELLRDIMNLEPLLSDDDIAPDSILEATTFPDQALYSYMMQLAELRLYKLVRWARNLPQFGAISTDDQILLLQNCWSELIGLALCWRSIDTPNQISISSTHHITTEWAQHIGCEDLVARLLSISHSFRNLFMDEYEYVALKVLLLISPDVKGLKEPRKIRDFQDKLMEALMVYTVSHYDMKNKFGELLLRLPELSRLSFLSKNILLKHLPTSSTTCGLLVELLKGDSRLEAEGGASSGFANL